MQNLFEAAIATRSLLRERTAAAIEDWELLLWSNHAAKDIAKRTLCYEQEKVIPTTDKIRLYEWKYNLPDFAGRVRAAWYRNYPLRLIQDIDKKVWYQSFFTSTSSQPLEFYYDSQAFGIKWVPSVTNYSTGLTTFTKGSTAVTTTGDTSNIAAHWAIGTGAEPGKYYSIRSIDSSTTLTLDTPFLEETVTAGAYLATDGAVRLMYAAVPPQLSTISYTTAMAATITVTNGSRTVTSSGAPAWLTNARRGMHFGVGTATGSTKPSKWYIIRKVVSNTSLELSQPYEEATAAGTANGLITEDSPFEPTIMEMVVLYAAAMGLKKYGNAEGDNLLGQYEARVGQLKGEIDARYQRHSPPPRITDTWNGYIPELDGW